MLPNSQTRVCAIVGNPVRHSLSPLIHNQAFAATGLNFVYVAFEVEDLAAAMAGVRSLGIAGLSVTIPHKEAIIPLLDEVDQFASGIGAVNTVVNRGGRLHGHNTDAAGVLYALEEGGIRTADQHVLVAGAGGAARAVAFGLALKGGISSLTILDPVAGKAAALARDVVHGSDLQDVQGQVSSEAKLPALLEKVDLVVNASPVGMHPNEGNSPIPLELLSERHAVFDVIYTPRETRLVQRGRELGATAVCGDRMFLKQAEEQFRLWTDIEAPSSVMAEVLEAHLGK